MAEEYKSPVCPKCGEPTDRLYVNVACTMSVGVEEGELFYDEEEEILDVLGSYFCPHCEEDIAETKEEAIRFLTS